MAGDRSDDSLRGRLLRAGAAALTDAELLALLLEGDRVELEAVGQARALLGDLGGLAGLRHAPAQALRRHGLNEFQIATLGAAVEFARRMAFAEIPRHDPLRSPQELIRYLNLCFAGQDQEILGALFLDSSRHLLACREIFRGTLERIAVEPRAILKAAFLTGASSIVLFHTHPSGDPEPSAEDLLFTRRMNEAVELVGLVLDDHLIVGDAGRWVSLVQHDARENASPSRRARSEQTEC